MSYYKRRETEIRKAIEEARRFISKAESTLDAMMKDEPRDGVYYYWNKEHAAMKRASLDLQEALIKLRKPLL